MAVIRNIPVYLGVIAVLLALGASLPSPNTRSSGCSSGVQFYSDPTDCNAYYQCANGSPVQLRCGAGLHWNNNAFACDWPANAGCVLGEEEKSGGDDDDDDSGDSSKSSGDDSTSEESVPGSDSSSSESSECPADSKPPSCPAIDPALSVFFPHSGDSHWFYHCSNGVAYCKVCPSPLVWNPKCDTCDWEGQDNCPKEESSESGDSSKSSGDDSTSEESVPGSDSSSSESSECPADSKPPSCPATDPALSVFFPHSGDSHWFYHCSNGAAYCKVCPSPLVWNPKCDTCDWEGQDNCPKEESSESGDSSKSSGDDSTSEESVPGSDSSSSESEPAPTEKPTQKPTEKPSSESGDSSKSSGDDSTSEESVPGSDSSSSSSESSECPADSKPPSCPATDPALSVFFLHSGDSHWFYHCSNGVAYCKVCPSPLVWNPKCDTCDWEGQDNCPKEESSESGDSSKSSGDDSTSEESVPGSDSSSSSSSESVECPADSNPPKCPATDPALSVFFPHTGDSHWFYHCSNGVAYCKGCPSTLVWNSNCDTCDWEGQDNCPKSSESGDSSKSSGDDSTSEESVPGSDSSSSEE